mmetsp:Transcript_22962/g.59936  ORF Transcript_22962/g.59936 Transcript_22962/m.59936 type:complete len:253 (+) Transcript_22962:1241-1999(+)
MRVPLAQQQPAVLGHGGDLEDRGEAAALHWPAPPASAAGRLRDGLPRGSKPQAMDQQLARDAPRHEVAVVLVHRKGADVVGVDERRIPEDPPLLRAWHIGERRDFGVDATGQEHARIWAGREAEHVGLVLPETVEAHAGHRVPDVHQPEAVPAGHHVGARRSQSPNEGLLVLGLLDRHAGLAGPRGAGPLRDAGVRAAREDAARVGGTHAHDPRLAHGDLVRVVHAPRPSGQREEAQRAVVASGAEVAAQDA